MEMIFVVFRSSLEADILRVLEQERIAGFTMLPDILGIGATGRALHAYPWPASNTLLLAALEEPDTGRLLAALEAFRAGAARNQHGADIPLRVFTVPCRQAL